MRAEVDFVNPDEAKKLVTDEGYVVLDVRDKTQYERAHIKSCYHVPLFIENQDNDFGTIIKRTVHNNFSGLFFGLPFTKLNDKFVDSVQSQLSPKSKLLIVCQEGLRSTAAANKLEAAGFRNVACVTSGLQSVKPGTFDSEGSTELQDAGKAGLITIQGKISAVLGTVLISISVHHLLPGSSRKAVSTSPVELVLVIIPSFASVNGDMIQERWLLKFQQHNILMNKREVNDIDSGRWPCKFLRLAHQKLRLV